jgi:uncharacterized tellurite resistance protein B-like protein
MRALKNLLDSFISPAHAPSPEESARALQLATAVLLVEVMRADPEVGEKERAVVTAALQTKFGLDMTEIDALLNEARQESAQANDYFRFTSLINDHCEHDDKVRMIEQMWRAAYADADLGANENHVIAKVAGLLHVTHGEYIAAKLRAKPA